MRTTSIAEALIGPDLRERAGRPHPKPGEVACGKLVPEIGPFRARDLAVVGSPSHVHVVLAAALVHPHRGAAAGRGGRNWGAGAQGPRLNKGNMIAVYVTVVAAVCTAVVCMVAAAAAIVVPR